MPPFSSLPSLSPRALQSEDILEMGVWRIPKDGGKSRSEERAREREVREGELGGILMVILTYFYRDKREKKREKEFRGKDKERRENENENE